MTYAAWHDHPPRKKKPVDLPIMTESRQLAIADAITPTEHDRIHQEAVEAAAKIMEEWEWRSGRK